MSRLVALSPAGQESISISGRLLKGMRLLPDLALFGLGLILGIVCLAISPLGTIAVLAAVGLLVSVIKWPELLPLLFLVLTSTIIRMDQAPSLPIGVGTLYLTDIVFLLSLGYIGVNTIARDIRIVRTPLDWPLAVFWIASLTSTLIAVAHASLPWKQSLQESRVVTAYLMFFVVTNLISSKNKVVRLTRGLIVLATVVAVLTIAQYASGHGRLILAGRIETFGGVARIIPPGQSLIMVAFTAVFAAFVLDKANVRRFCQCAILALALAVTFFRASWVVTAANMLVIGLLARGQEKKRLIISVAIAGVLAVAVLVAVIGHPDSSGARLLDATAERAATLLEARTFDSQQSSLRWRDFEYKYALPQIVHHPLLGLGLGARYRPLTAKDHEGFDGRDFIHNGHVYVLLKSGIIAYASLMAFLIIALSRGFKNWRRIPDCYMRAVMLAFSLIFGAVLLVSLVEPYIMQLPWTPLIGIIAGINEVILRQFYTPSATSVTRTIQ